MRSIFIAYRQSDAKAWAIGLRDAMAEVFGEEAVFLDKDALHAGKWSEQIQQAILSCRVMLLVVGQQWACARDDSGQLRLQQSHDVHRQELVLALTLPGLTVLPVRVDGARMPEASELPEQLLPLLSLQSYEIGDARRSREVDITRIVSAVEGLTGLSARRASRPAAANRVSTYGALAAASLLTASIAIYFSMTSMRLAAMELLVVLLAAIGLSFGMRMLWRLLKKGRRED